ncbi:response regulator [Oceaniglobus ichthyenteri]|uniref:response regulator n=1 Tax=Oceaniglobus ichthyenteri TaxID=2136177 RepID=UPI000D3CC083|nr:response regulator [Oceaniglobus ichthyenteri]
MKILAVDDDEYILEILSMLVIKAGFPDIVTATSAGDALDRITSTSEPFQCILLDIQMPIMDGVEFCDLLRRLPDYGECPIIMVTAMTDKVWMDQAYGAGATDYIIKPFDYNILSARLTAAANAVAPASEDVSFRTSTDIRTISGS